MKALASSIAARTAFVVFGLFSRNFAVVHSALKEPGPPSTSFELKHAMNLLARSC